MEFVTIIVTRAEETKHDVGIIKQAVFLIQKAAKPPKNGFTLKVSKSRKKIWSVLRIVSFVGFFAIICFRDLLTFRGRTEIILYKMV